MSIEYLQHTHKGILENDNTQGVSVYGIHDGEQMFEPLFHAQNKSQALQIVDRLCTACSNPECPQWRKDLKSCYSIIEHD